MKVAVIGGGISGLVSAYSLVNNGVNVTLYEKENNLGGHAKTVTFDGVDLDVGFTHFNPETYPNLIAFFESIGVEIERSDVSYSVSIDKGKGCEWGNKNGYSSLFAQKKNLFNPYFHQMIREITNFKKDVLSYLEGIENNPDIDRNETLGEFIKSRGYSEYFKKTYIIPICSLIHVCPSEGVLSLSAFTVLSFIRNHQLLQPFDGAPSFTVKGRSQSYVEKVRVVLETKGCQIRSGCNVQMISTTDEGCTIVHSEDGSKEMYDRCILAIPAPDALRILGEHATVDERSILGSFLYAPSDIYLHCDTTLMPQNTSIWSAFNFLGNSKDNKVSLTYWLNDIQNLNEISKPYLLTLDPEEVPKKTLLKWKTRHFVPSVSALKASLELHRIQGIRGIWFCGAYQGYGFHEDGLKTGISAANGMLGKSCNFLSNPKQMIPSFVETEERYMVTRFLGRLISAGCSMLLEDGGNMFGSTKQSPNKTSIKDHSPQFYWKVFTSMATLDSFPSSLLKS